MHDELSLTFHSWLSQLNIPVSLSYVRKKFLSHSDYPSMAAFTDILDDLSIDNAVYVVDGSNWSELPFPFLAHTSKNGGQFILVQKDDAGMLQKGGKLEHWEGVGLFAEKPSGWVNAEVDRINKGQRLKRNTVLLLSCLLLGLAFLSIGNDLTWQQVFLFLTSIAGFGLAVLILQKELGVSNVFMQKLCGGDESSCSDVIMSEGSKPAKWFRWTDAGIVFFAAFLLLALRNNPVLPIMSTAALPFLFFSVYYQWRVVKKWCALCLLTLFVLAVQFAVQVPAIRVLATGLPSVSFFAEAGFVLLMIASLWLMAFRPLLKDNKMQEEENYVLQRFKNNSNLFKSLLGLQRKVDVRPWRHDLQLGNPGAATQILVACSLYCGPCANAHDVLHELVVARDVGLTIRFSIRPDLKDDRRTIAVEYMLQLLEGKSAEYKRKALHDWYQHMNLDMFKQQYPLEEVVDVDTALTDHGNWSSQVKITHTPTIFINGSEMPEEYMFADLLMLIRNNEVVEPVGTEDQALA